QSLTFFAQQMWLLVPVQGKIKDFFADYEMFPHQEGSSLNAGGIGYAMIRQAGAMKRLKEFGHLHPTGCWANEGSPVEHQRESSRGHLRLPIVFEHSRSTSPEFSRPGSFQCFPSPIRFLAEAPVESQRPQAPPSCYA